MKTTLDVFNKVSEHLLRQNEQALDEDGECAYRSETGLKCAVGCLIKDEFYSEDFEGLYAVGCNSGEWITPIKNALELSGVPITEDVKDLVEQLQLLHDRTLPEVWEEELEKLKLTFFRGAV